MSHSFYSQDIHGPFETYDLGDFELEEGGTIRGLKLAYATFGALSPNKDNAILFPTWYSGTNKILEQAYVGPGRALDPSKYFIILITRSATGFRVRPAIRRLPSTQRAFRAFASATTCARSIA